MAKANARTDGGSSTSSEFKVVIPNGELAQIRNWVLQYPSTETGGDLFGLWSKDGTAVVQFVLGPGQNSRHNAMSYFQDTKYLAKAGSVLTQQFGLCHIGEWHSHHTLGLAQPSDGDQRTVWNNMPNYGFKRFIVFIANLDKETQSRTSSTTRNYSVVGLGCFLFEVKNTKTEQQCHMRQGSFQVTEGQGAYRQLEQLFSDGAESISTSHEVMVKNVQSRSRGYERGHILLYREIKELDHNHLAKSKSISLAPPQQQQIQPNQQRPPPPRQPPQQQRQQQFQVPRSSNKPTGMPYQGQGNPVAQHTPYPHQTGPHVQCPIQPLHYTTISSVHQSRQQTISADGTTRWETTYQASYSVNHPAPCQQRNTAPHQLQKVVRQSGTQNPTQTGQQKPFVYGRKP